MMRRYSIADARAQLPAIIKAAEKGQVVSIERRGTPVAVVVSLSDYRRLAGGTESMWSAWQSWRRRHPEGLELDDDEVASWRQRDAGRKVEL